MAFLYMVKHNIIPGAVYDAISKHSVLAIILVINLCLLQCVHGSSFSSSENYDRHSRDINIKTLPPDGYSDGYSHDHGNDFYASEVRNSADALLSNWDGDHWASLDAEQDMVNLQWSSNSEEITFQVEVKGTGWISLALTFRGNLMGSDIIIGWVASDQSATIIDAHGNQFGQVIRDRSQDYKMIIGYQYQRKTVLRFRRKLETCDGEDLTITNDTFKVVWSYSNSDPVNWDDGQVNSSVDLTSIFPPAHRTGARSLHLFESHNPADHLHITNTALKWHVQSNSVLLPAKATLYWCTMLRLPELPGKHHMIGYRPKLTPGNERYLHHMMLYECHGGDGPDESYNRFDHHVNSGYECNAPNMPRDFKKCKGVVAGWGVGGEPFAFPEEAGYPVGEEHGGSTYYMFEAHYDNPAMHENVVDSSGMEVLLTPKLRKYDSALLTVGHDVSSLHLIPPGLDHFTTVAHCPDMCTQALPPEGINVFAGLPHTHNIGEAIRMRQLRSGVERPVPFQDRFFDPNYQTMRKFQMKLLPNDHLITECTYNSTVRTGFTRGGFTATNEMCLLFLHYYPATRLAHCASRLSFKHVLLALGVNVWPLTSKTRHLGLRIKDPWQYQNLTFSDYLRVAATKDTAVSLKLQEASLHHSHKAECYDYGRRKIYADGIEFSTPRIRTPIYEVSNGCYGENEDYTVDISTGTNQPLKNVNAAVTNTQQTSSQLLITYLSITLFIVLSTSRMNSLSSLSL